MKAFSNPTLFSKHFKIDPHELEQAGLIDPFLDVATELFIDPILLEYGRPPADPGRSASGFAWSFQQCLPATGHQQARWGPTVEGQRILELAEAPSNGLGYGKGDRDGTSRPDELRDTILSTSEEVVQLGRTDPEMISLMGFFEENFGPDTISDLIVPSRMIT